MGQIFFKCPSNSWPLEAPGLHDTNLNTLSTQTPRGQELLGYIKKELQINIMACFSSSLMTRVLNFMRNPKLVLETAVKMQRYWGKRPY